MNNTYKYYFLFVFLTCIYGIECNVSYLFTLILTNIYYTAGEYFFHRITFHNTYLSPLLSKMHSKHHIEPTNEKRLFIPILITILNDILFIGINYCLNTNIFHFISASHLSYLLFEVSHYASHIPLAYSILPKRLISFHIHHHYNDETNYGFTTPAWDILFNTGGNFSLYHYPLCYLPLSIISFISIQELVIISNLIYLYPAYFSYQFGFYFVSVYYILTGIVSMLYHINIQNTYYRILDYVIASGYFMISLWFFIMYSHAWEPVIWCVMSLIAFIYDRNCYTHILWHSLTAIGVGRMITGSRV